MSGISPPSFSAAKVVWVIAFAVLGVAALPLFLGFLFGGVGFILLFIVVGVAFELAKNRDHDT